MLLAGLGAVLVSLQLPKVYEAKATVIVGQSLSTANPDYSQLLVSQQLSTTYANLATTRPILETVISQLGLKESTAELAKRVRAVAPSDSTLLAISAQDGDPSRAAAIANAVANQLVVTSATIQGGQADLQATIDTELKATLEQIDAAQGQVERLGAAASPDATDVATLQALQAQLTTLRSTYASLLSVSSGGAGRMTVVDPAVAPESPVAPNPILNTLVAASLGLLVAAGLVFVAEYVDDTVKDPAGVQDVAGLPTLGTISRMEGDRGRGEHHRLATLLYPRSAAAEAYRTLRTNLEFASVDAPVGTLLVTSSLPGEGKTITAANLAVVFAQSGRRVLLVDADLRRPGVHLVFDLPNSDGLTTLLRSDESDVDAIANTTEQENLRVLTTGSLPPNPAELLGSQRMRRTVERLKAAADLVIFDSPPLQAVADAVILSSFLDATLFVTDVRSHRGPVQQGREALAKASANVLGAVLNRVPVHDRSGYTQYYGTYASSEGTDTRAQGAERPATRSTP